MGKLVNLLMIPYRRRVEKKIHLQGLVFVGISNVIEKFI
jgi:hypothetical protein